MDFNPRPREEGDTYLMLFVIALRNFNPRPREEGDLRHYYLDEIAFISIHALVKRATVADSQVKSST